MFRDVLVRYRQTLAADALDVGIVQVKLGHALLRQQKCKEAAEESLAGYTIMRKQIDRSGSWPRTALKDLVEEHEQMKDFLQARHYRQELTANRG